MKGLWGREAFVIRAACIFPTVVNSSSQIRQLGRPIWPPPPSDMKNHDAERTVEWLMTVQLCMRTQSTGGSDATTLFRENTLKVTEFNLSWHAFSTLLREPEACSLVAEFEPGWREDDTNRPVSWYYITPLKLNVTGWDIDGRTESWLSVLLPSLHRMCQSGRTGCLHPRDNVRWY